MQDWLRAESELLHPIQVRISESETAFEIKAEAPGFAEKDLEISVEPKHVAIIGERAASEEEKKGRTIYTQTCANQIMRVIELPTEVNADKSSAILNNGILELKLPKLAKAQPGKVQPKVAA